MSLSTFAGRLGLVTLSVSVVLLAWYGGLGLRDRLATPAGETRIVLADGGQGGAAESATIALFDRAKDSVVFISTEARVRDPWRQGARTVPQGTGSGFVWDRQGHIVTNAHVLSGASGAVVRLADGSAHRARLVGVAPQHDLAVLRIQARGLSPLPRGDSTDLRVGQSTFAIGNPFGLDFTLTTGIVSALDRDLPANEGPSLRGLVQTDAAINPGNSGGPLLDSAGRLIGVNTAIYSPSGSSAGIGFAVPSDTVARVVPQIIRTGRYAPPILGIDVDERVNVLARRQGLDGILVLGVTPGSAAARAGLEPARVLGDGRLDPGDALVAIDAAPLRSVEDLASALDSYMPGDRVALMLRRDGRTREVNVTLDPPGQG